MSDPDAWSLHPQLVKDTHHVDDLTLSRLLIIKDANYPWVVLVPRRPNVSEVIDLGPVDQAQLMREITAAGIALKEISACDKLNIAALGNMVPQLHVHIIARTRNDPAWPHPVWGKVKPRHYDNRTLGDFEALLRKALTLS